MTFPDASVINGIVKRRVHKKRKAFKARHVFIAGIIAVMIPAVVGDKGLFDVLKLKGELEEINKFNSSLEKENRDIEKMIGLLKTDNRYIEHIAKTELGMIGKDEIVYKIEDAE